MVKTIEKFDVLDSPTGRFYDTNLIQERFKLPERKEDHKKNSFSFLYDSSLLIYFCLRDKRFRQILNVVFKLTRQIKNHNYNAPLYVKNAFIELGPTFIKIGQFLSSRADLIPKKYIEALSELQDSLPPLPFEGIKETIETELRKSVNKIFKSIDPEPIASASIGQVHKAELLNGLSVIVKVQRPDLNTIFYKDLAILRCLAVYFEQHTEFGKGREWIQIIDEIGKTLFEEIDFIQEGKNADHLRKNLKYDERVYIPKIFWQYTTRKLIVIEFMSGVKITDIESLKQKDLNPRELAITLVNIYFKQFFEDGFYHADPHPGNIVVKDDGTIVFYDFGMVGRINENIRNELANVLLSVVRNDTDTLLSSLKNLKLIKPDTDIEPIKKIIEQAVYDYYDGGKLTNLNLDGLEEDINNIIKEKPFILPSKFTYTLRMTGTLEGVCRTLDPEFSLINVAKPYLQNWLKNNLVQSESKWNYLKAIFPKQNKLIKKLNVYMEVVKELPKYIANIEKASTKNPQPTISEEKPDLKLKEFDYLKKEMKETNSKLKVAYIVIFLLCFTLFGSNLIQNQNYIINIFGFVLLSSSLIGSIGMVWWYIINKKMIE